MSEKDRIPKHTRKLPRKSRTEENSIHEATNVIQEKDVSDAARAVRTSRQFLKILGVWQPNEPGKFYWRLVLKNISVLACYFGLGIFVLLYSLFITIEVKDYLGKLKLIGHWILCVMGSLKYWFLRSHQRDIDQCLKHIKLDWLRTESSSNRDIMMDHVRYGKLVTMICIVLTYSGGTLFVFCPFFMTLIAANDANDNVTLLRAHPIPSSFIFDIATETPTYEIIYAFQGVVAYMIHSITIAIYSLAVVIVMHACGQLKIVMGMLNNLVDRSNENMMYDSVNSRMSNIVKHHVRTLRFVSSAEKMLREICLVDLGGYTLNLCLAVYYIFLEWAAENKNALTIVTYLSILFSFLFNIFSFCYIGELLTGECRKVAETTYMIDWYRLPGKQALGLGLIIAMANSPVTLTAGGAIQLSFTCFANVVKTSMGYLNMLRATMT